MDEKDKIIIRQVAFKGAIELIPEHVKWVNSSYLDEPKANQLVAAVSYLTDEFEKIILKTWKHPRSS